MGGILDPGSSSLGQVLARLSFIVCLFIESIIDPSHSFFNQSIAMHNKIHRHYGVSRRLWCYLLCVFLLRAGQSLAPSSSASNSIVSGNQRQNAVGSTNYQLMFFSRGHVKRRRLQLSNATATGEVVNTGENATDNDGNEPLSTTEWIIVGVAVVVVAALCLVCCTVEQVKSFTQVIDRLTECFTSLRNCFEDSSSETP
jgi:hypothetical protein